MVFSFLRKKQAPAAPVEPVNEVPSPCSGVCDMDWLAKLCKSCNRTVVEIGGWAEMDDDQRRAVLAAIEERKGG